MSSSGASFVIWVGFFPPTVSSDSVYDELSVYRPKKAQYDPSTLTLELYFSDEPSAAAALHALNGRTMFGRILSARPLPVPPTGPSSFHMAASPLLSMPSYNDVIGARIQHLLAERPEFFQSVVLVLNGLALPSPFYPALLPEPTQLQPHDQPEQPLVGQRVKRTSESLPEDSPRKIPKLLESDEEQEVTENQPLHVMPHSAQPKTLEPVNLKIDLSAPGKASCSELLVEVVPFKAKDASDSDHDTVPLLRITAEELASNRLTADQIRAIPRFGDWNPGEPSLKLFVKNLASKTSEADLRFIFGRFSEDPKVEDIQIRLMTRGKLHGQAFVTFSDASAAQAAIAEVSGYVLHDRPMILEFGKAK